MPSFIWGLNTIRSLVLSLGIFSQYDQQALPRCFPSTRWRSIAGLTGVVARSVAQAGTAGDRKSLDQCFLAGLLHDVGQLVLAFGLPEEYAEVIAEGAARKTCRSGRWNRSISAPRMPTWARICWRSGGCPIPSSRRSPCIISRPGAPRRNFRPPSRSMSPMFSLHELAGTQHRNAAAAAGPAVFDPRWVWRKELNLAGQLPGNSNRLKRKIL